MTNAALEHIDDIVLCLVNILAVARASFALSICFSKSLLMRRNSTTLALTGFTNGFLGNLYAAIFFCTPRHGN